MENYLDVADGESSVTGGDDPPTLAKLQRRRRGVEKRHDPRPAQVTPFIVKFLCGRGWGRQMRGMSDDGLELGGQLRTGRNATS